MTDSPSTDPGGSALTRDASDLRRAVFVNLLGYAIKVAHPVLTWCVIFFYGAEEYGFFVAAQAIVMVAMRVSMLGLDHGLLWWVSRGDKDSGIASSVRGVLMAVGGASLVATGVCFGFAPWLAAWKGHPSAALGLQLMAASVLPMCITETLIAVAQGQRRMEPRVFVNEGLVPILTAGLGVALFFMGREQDGLSMSFLAARVVGLFALLWYLPIVGVSLRREPGRGARLPRELVRYTVPLWGVEIITSLLMRLDALVLAAMTSPATVGIYGAVTQISNTMRQIRAAFDPIVIAILSRAGAERNRERLVSGFSYSTVLVVTTQVPVYVFILLFGGWILGLLGADFGTGESALIVLCGFWVFCSTMGLQGFILRGYGRSALLLVGSIFTLVVQGALLWILIPRLGLVGAALAVGLAYTLLSFLNAYLAFHVTGRVWPYNRSVAQAIGWVSVAIAVLALAYLGAGELLTETPRRIAAFIAFSMAYAFVLYRLHRAGILLGRTELSRAAR